MTVYVAVDIGCIECGEPSAVLGVFGTEDAADAAVRVAWEKWHDDAEAGTHNFEIFQIEYTPAEAIA